MTVVLSSTVLAMSVNMGNFYYIIFIFRRKLCPMTPGLLTLRM